MECIQKFDELLENAQLEDQEDDWIMFGVVNFQKQAL